MMQQRRATMVASQSNKSISMERSNPNLMQVFKNQAVLNQNLHKQ